LTNISCGGSTGLSSLHPSPCHPVHCDTKLLRGAGGEPDQ